MAEQVTDKLEKKLQETPGIDKIRSYSKPGETLIFVQVNEATRGRDVADAWYQVRKKVSDMRGTAAAERAGAVFQRRVRRRLRRDVRVFQPTVSITANSRTTSRRCASVCSRCANVSKVDLFGVQDEKIYIEISHRKLAQIGLDIPQLAAQIGAAERG